MIIRNTPCVRYSNFEIINGFEKHDILQTTDLNSIKFPRPNNPTVNIICSRFTSNVFESEMKLNIIDLDRIRSILVLDIDDYSMSSIYGNSNNDLQISISGVLVH